MASGGSTDKPQDAFWNGYVRGALATLVVAAVVEMAMMLPISDAWLRFIACSALLLPGIIYAVVRPPPLKAQRVSPVRKDERSASEEDKDGTRNGWPAGYADPYRWTFLPSTGILKANVPRASVADSDLCKTKVLVMHKPTHEKWREDDYPYAWHLHGKKRTWEVRLQMQFKKVPASPLWCALETGQPAQVSGAERVAHEMMVSAVRRVVGADLYATPGSAEEEEVEPATMAIDFQVFDQFAVHTAGEEPPLHDDLTGVGTLRTEVGRKAFSDLIRQEMEELSEDKVYTFCFWGVARFLDVMRWRVQPPIGWEMDFNKVAQAPPIYFGLYELADAKEGQDPLRHLPSRKVYYMRVAVWSDTHPPAAEVLSRLVPSRSNLGPDEEQSEASCAAKRRMQKQSRLVNSLAIVARLCSCH
mmetsp:Transcript_58782/g.131477  ORF Transcript_58782/g.131477 Transcript_58782/m.131477 type:complete len:416 (+) Transcript_58782:106-1353(+)